MYVALSYIGSDYTPGEILPDDTDAELIRRLLKAGAIRETAPVPEAYKPVEAENDTSPSEEKAEESAEEEVTEIDEEEEAPEIDIMDGIVQDEPKPAAKKSRRKTK